MDHPTASTDDEAEAATDELVRLLLDELAPLLHWYRDEVARRLGLSSAELLCLDLCRGEAVTSGRIGERLGLTRSAVAKMVRRLEVAGHVERRPSWDHAQEIEVRLRPHRARDAVLAGLRGRVRRSVADLVATHGLRDRRHALVAGALVALSSRVFQHASELADAAAERRLHAARRRAREAEPASPWWR